MYIKYIKQLLGRTRGEGTRSGGDGGAAPTPPVSVRREEEGSYLYANALDFYTPEELQKRTFGIGS